VFMFLNLPDTIINGSANDTTASISGTGFGLYDYSGGDVTNFGTITGGRAGAYLGRGVYLNGFYGYHGTYGDLGPHFFNGSVTNGSAADRAALISGGVGVELTPYDSGSVTITNFGTIAGVGGVAVDLRNASGVLVVEAGSTFVGQVLGAGGT